jgi:ribonuclease HI
MNKILLFIDGSVDVQFKTGFGACLVVSDPVPSPETLKKQVKVKRFEQTSSTKLELETLLWAVSELSIEGKEIIIYTDSQNITKLPQRRDRLEKNYFRSKNNRQINNSDLYMEFFKMIDMFDCEFVKVQGHQPTKYKDEIHRLFTLVDRASRNALRKEKKILTFGHSTVNEKSSMRKGVDS